MNCLLNVFPKILKVDHFMIVGFGKNYPVENQFVENGCPILGSITDYIVFIVHYSVKIGNVNGYAKGFQIGRMDLSKYANTKAQKIIHLPLLKQYIKKQLFLLFNQCKKMKWKN